MHFQEQTEESSQPRLSNDPISSWNFPAVKKPKPPPYEPVIEPERKRCQVRTAV